MLAVGISRRERGKNDQQCDRQHPVQGAPLPFAARFLPHQRDRARLRDGRSGHDDVVLHEQFRRLSGDARNDYLRFIQHGEPAPAGAHATEAGLPPPRPGTCRAPRRRPGVLPPAVPSRWLRVRQRSRRAERPASQAEPERVGGLHAERPTPCRRERSCRSAAPRRRRNRRRRPEGGPRRWTAPAHTRTPGRWSVGYGIERVECGNPLAGDLPASKDLPEVIHGVCDGRGWAPSSVDANVAFLAAHKRRSGPVRSGRRPTGGEESGGASHDSLSGLCHSIAPAVRAASSAASYSAIRPRHSGCSLAQPTWSIHGSGRRLHRTLTAAGCPSRRISHASVSPATAARA